jgi:2-polyprenyl-3-methyl-5-hydroxy-6-metoxy-1,4-benzoquinol methylase
MFFSVLLCLALIVFIVTFGLPIFTGAPFAVSSLYKINKMIALAKKFTAGKEGLTAVDVGSGDGRIVIALARNGFSAHGIEINPFLAWYSRLKIKKAGLNGRALIRRKNLWQADFSQYNVVVLFGVFYIMAKLEKKLLSELKPGSIVVCNHFSFPTWKILAQEGDVYIYQIK